MKPFNLEEALAGKPVKLREGTKAYVKFQLRNWCSTPSDLVGFVTYETTAHCDEDFLLRWKDTGEISYCRQDPRDIIGMWE